MSGKPWHFELRGSRGALSAREAAVLELWDAGRSMQAIAQRLKLPRASVSRIITDFHDSGEHTRARSAMAAFSAKLAAAVLRERRAA